MKRKPDLRKETPTKKAAPPHSRKSRSTAATIAPPSLALAFRESLLHIERARHRTFHTELIDFFHVRHLLAS